MSMYTYKYESFTAASLSNLIELPSVCVNLCADNESDLTVVGDVIDGNVTCLGGGIIKPNKQTDKILAICVCFTNFFPVKRRPVIAFPIIPY